VVVANDLDAIVRTIALYSDPETDGAGGGLPAG
jgi:hypothetical protein